MAMGDGSCMMCTTCMSGSSRGQKRKSAPMELEIQMAVSHPVGAGNRAWESGSASSALHC